MRWIAAVLGLVLSLPAAAQQVTLETSAAVSCLTPPVGQRGAPDYPFVAFKADQTGRVQVMLTFTASDARPAVKVLAHEGDYSFVESVEEHVRRFRLPCHDGGPTPVQLQFDFDFRPDDQKVYASAPVDGDAADRQAQLACMMHKSGAKQTEYPQQALRIGAQGRVLARLRFEAPDQPPAVEILPRAGPEASQRARRATQVFLDPIEAWVAGLRMPCLSGRPITTIMTFVYRMDGEAYGFKPGLTLLQLLPIVRNIRVQRLNFDFTQMGCPFEVALQYRQPRLPNWVSEMDTHNLARQPFLDWLRQSDFDLPDPSLEVLYGDTVQVAVPCVKINLNPQE